MRRLAFVLLALSLAGQAFASYGGHAGALSRVGFGARTLGFGGAVVSLAHDPASILVNPAGAAYSGGGIIVGSHTFMSLDRSINVLGFARRIDPHAGFSFAWVNSGVGAVPGYDADGNPTGTLDNTENAIALTFGNRLGWLAAGVSAKWFQYRLDSRTSSGWTFDLGLLATPYPGLSFGASVRDLVGSLIWSTDVANGTLRTEDGFPLVVTAGASYRVDPLRTTVASDFESVEGEGEYLHFGASWQPADWLRLRAGYRWLNIGKGAHQATPTAGLSVVTGFGDGFVSFDYAVLGEPLGLVHSLGVELRL